MRVCARHYLVIATVWAEQLLPLRHLLFFQRSLLFSFFPPRSSLRCRYQRGLRRRDALDAAHLDVRASPCCAQCQLTAAVISVGDRSHCLTSPSSVISVTGLTVTVSLRLPVRHQSSQSATGLTVSLRLPVCHQPSRAVSPRCSTGRRVRSQQSHSDRDSPQPTAHSPQPTAPSPQPTAHSPGVHAAPPDADSPSAKRTVSHTATERIPGNELR